MPEGDTIFRAASTLSRALSGKVVRRFRSSAAGTRGAPVEGRTIASVEAIGKNLLVRFDDGRSLRTHMRMHGSWHIYRPGERWQKPAAFARTVIETDDFVAVCFSAPVVEWVGAGSEPTHSVLSRLGPDVLDPGFAEEEALARLRANPDREIGDALLQQGIVAGIGNIWKSETLFRCRVDPFAAVAALPDAELSRIVREARKLMARSANASGARAKTALSGGWEVYRRSGKPCRRCGAAIIMRRQGSDRRSTYFCPHCQNARG